MRRERRESEGASGESEGVREEGMWGLSEQGGMRGVLEGKK